MKEFEKLIEDINEFADDLETVEDQFNGAEIDMNDTVIEPQNATEMLAAKTKISRAFDVLKDAFNDFQDQIVDSIELSGDNDITTAIDALANSVTSLQQAIAPQAAKSTPFEMDYQGFDAEPEIEEDEFDLSNDVEDFENSEKDENGLGDDELEKNFDDEATIKTDLDDELDAEIEDELK